MKEKIQDQLHYIKSEFEKRINPEESEAMAKYMRNLFPYIGMKMPARKEILRPVLKSISSAEEAICLAEELWQLEEREYQYAGLDILQTKAKKIDAGQLVRLKELVKTKSWWDTVDRLAASVIGPAVKKDTKLREEVFSWREDNYLWLERTAIIFQLKYHKETDVEMLMAAILPFVNSEEFFHQKAIGWALRNYSKSNPDWVRRFIKETPLKPLSVREGSKYI
jgi:3-methyladenine DNA glycosylase AlkD